ncbi:uncharacterized protein [Rutidosis leptorrhynchoides]|uniref:uncharacterized protein n=1 Tax=Rutidosis leptorrhynchoides TaxID=125765 RepID=UPI003A9A24BB
MQQKDTWRWDLSGNGIFKCKVLSGLIDSKLLNTSSSASGTLRNSFVPKKVEVFVWRVNKGRIPVLVELDKRGIDLNSVRCPLCDNDIECLNHALIKCEKVRELWLKIFEWWNISQPSTLNISDILKGNVGQFGSDLGKRLWQSTLWSCIYHIWKTEMRRCLRAKVGRYRLP